jgi:hypothetical protein
LQPASCRTTSVTAVSLHHVTQVRVSGKNLGDSARSALQIIASIGLHWPVRRGVRALVKNGVHFASNGRARNAHLSVGTNLTPLAVVRFREAVRNDPCRVRVMPMPQRVGQAHTSPSISRALPHEPELLPFRPAALFGHFCFGARLRKLIPKIFDSPRSNHHIGGLPCPIDRLVRLSGRGNPSPCPRKPRSVRRLD